MNKTLWFGLVMLVAFCVFIFVNSLLVVGDLEARNAELEGKNVELKDNLVRLMVIVANDENCDDAPFENKIPYRWSDEGEPEYIVVDEPWNSSSLAGFNLSESACEGVENG